MDFYQRKKQAQELIKKLLEKGIDFEKIAFLVEETYQFSQTWTKKYVKMIGDARGENESGSDQH